MSGPPTDTVQPEARARVRAARARVARAWTSGGRGTRSARALGGVLAAALLGAFLFGAWHVLLGGFVKGNWRAGAFGLVLAAVTGVLLAAEAAIARRVLPRSGGRGGRAC